MLIKSNGHEVLNKEKNDASRSFYHHRMLIIIPPEYAEVGFLCDIHDAGCRVVFVDIIAML